MKVRKLVARQSPCNQSVAGDPKRRTQLVERRAAVPQSRRVFDLRWGQKLFQAERPRRSDLPASWISSRSKSMPCKTPAMAPE